MAKENRTKTEIGKAGEDLAAQHLTERGFVVVARNYRHKRAEIDLVVQQNDWLIFVEVKARSSSAFGEPESFVDQRKGNLLMQAAEAFVHEHDWHGHIRFDVISVKLGKPPVVEHFEDAIQ
jgi:putative endonuclease